MGQIQTKIALSNPRKAELDPLEVEALVDTGAATLCIPEHVAIQLNLAVLEQREVTTADGSKRKCDYVGPVQIRFGNRSCFSARWCLETVCCSARYRWKTWTWLFTLWTGKCRSIRKARIFRRRL